MKVVINGQEKQIQESSSIETIINSFQINQNNCIVELNGEVVQLEKFTTTLIRDGDRLELIRFIGGG